MSGAGKDKHIAQHLKLLTENYELRCELEKLKSKSVASPEIVGALKEGKMTDKHAVISRKINKKERPNEDKINRGKRYAMGDEIEAARIDGEIIKEKAKHHGALKRGHR